MKGDQLTTFYKYCITLLSLWDNIYLHFLFSDSLLVIFAQSYTYYWIKAAQPRHTQICSRSYTPHNLVVALNLSAESKTNE